jgi:phosphoribosylaminoimidazole carboxylase PurE protein
LTKPLVGIVAGSKSDLAVLKQAELVLKQLKIPYEITVSSAHRNPEKTKEYARQAGQRGLQVLLAGAGYAAHLAGAIAGHTLLPVIGIPLDSSPLKGIDSLLSTVMMPKGVPVATVTIGPAGAANAALLAAQILALKDERIAAALKKYREQWTTGKGVSRKAGAKR